MIVAVRLLVVVVLAGLAQAAAAQALDYRALIQGTESAEEQNPAPLQSLPVTRFDPASVPDGAAYGQLGPAAGEDGTTLGAARDLIEVFRARAVDMLASAPGAWRELITTLEAASPTGRAGYFLGIAVFTLLLLAVGRAVKTIFLVFIVRPLFESVQRPNPQGYLDKLPVLLYRIVLTLLGAALSLLVAGAIGLVYYDGHEGTLITTLVIFGAYAAFVFVDTVWRMSLAPYLPAYRLPTISDGDARRLYDWMSAISGFAIAAIAFCYWAKAIGLPHEPHALMTLGLTFMTVIGLLTALSRNRKAVRDAILAGVPRDRVSWLTLLALRLWMPAAVLYLIASWGKLAFNMVMGVQDGAVGLMVPYLVLLGGLLVYALTSYAIERAFSRRRQLAAFQAQQAARDAAEDATSGAARLAQAAEAAQGEAFGGAADVDGDGDDEGGTPQPGHQPERPEWVFDRTRGMRSFEDLARRVASLVAIGAAAWGLFYYWGGAGIFAENMMLGIAEDVIDILLVGYVLFHAIRIWMDQKIADEVGDRPETMEPGEGEGGTGATRLATLLPLVRNFILAMIAIAIFLVVASELGFNVAPLFAGAGILGLAIGFGSQTLVRDILSGAFFLMDDAFRKGEYIDVGTVKGTVEKISLRSFQLRHHLGMLHTIPFGEVGYLTNFSRDWVMMKLPLRVTYDTDVERVRKMIKKLGLELLEDPVIGDKFLAPLKSQGVIHMDDSAMIIRVKFMTKPGEQWVIRKRVFQEIRDLFEREGVTFAHREVTVRIPDLPKDRPLTPEEERALGGAARTAVDVVEAQALAPAGAGTADDR